MAVSSVLQLIPLISIHALLAESDHNRRVNLFGFQNFYPRSPCGERPWGAAPPSPPKAFLSTLSLRRATVHYDNYNLHCVISIHALLAESDLKPPVKTHGQKHFYPRSPCGERHFSCASERPIADFYPRSPCGERLCCYVV